MSSSLTTSSRLTSVQHASDALRDLLASCPTLEVELANTLLVTRRNKKVKPIACIASSGEVAGLLGGIFGTHTLGRGTAEAARLVDSSLVKKNLTLSA